jgi:hypothetical protein
MPMAYARHGGPGRTSMPETFQIRFGQVREFLGEGLDLSECAQEIRMTPSRIAQTRNGWRKEARAVEWVVLTHLLRVQDHDSLRLHLPLRLLAGKSPDPSQGESQGQRRSARWDRRGSMMDIYAQSPWMM